MPIRRYIRILTSVLLLFSVALGGCSISRADDQVLVLNTGGHTATPRAIVITQDAKYALTAGSDKVVRVWETGTAKNVGNIYGRAQVGLGDQFYAEALATEKSGKMTLAVAGMTTLAPLDANPRRNQFVIRLISIGSLDPVQAAPYPECPILGEDPSNCHSDTITSLAFAPDDPNTLASGSNDGDVRIWDIRNKTSRVIATGFRVQGITFSPGGRMLAACGLDGSLKVWQMSDLKEVTIDDGAAVPYHCLSWSPDGHYIFVGTDTGELRVWKDFALQPPLCRQDHAIQCVAVSADSKFVVTGQAANSKLATAHTTMPQVQIWDIAAGTMKASFTNDGAVNAVGISQAAESDLITAAGGASNDISFWRPGTGASEIKRGFGVGCVGSNIRWSSDLSADQSAHIPSKLRLRWTCTRSNPDGSTESSDLVYDCSTGTIRPPNPALDDATTWLLASVHQASSENIEFKDDKKYGLHVKVALTSTPSVEIPAGEVEPLSQWIPGYQSVALATDSHGKVNGVVIGSASSLALDDIDGKKQCDFAGHAGRITSIAISPDGQLLAATSTDQTVRVWKLTTPHDRTVQPLLSIFAGNEQRWIVWTEKAGEDRYYNCAPDGDSLIRWLPNADDERQLAVDADESANTSFIYNPATVKHVIEKADVTEAAIEAKSDEDQATIAARQAAIDVLQAKIESSQSEIESLKSDNTKTQAQKAEEIAKIQQVLRKEEDENNSLTNKVPPSVRIVAPSPNCLLTTDSASVTLEIKYKGSAKLTEVIITINGRSETTFHLSDADRAACASADGLRTSYDVSLIEKPYKADADRLNQLEAVVISDDKSVRSFPDDVSVFCSKAVVRPLKPNVYVLAIGISRYQLFEPLQFADADATAFADAIKSQEGKAFDKVKIVTLTEKQATKKNIEAALDQLKTQKINPYDLTMVFVSGHAGASVDDRYYYLPQDADTWTPDTVEKTCVPWSEIDDTLNSMLCQVFLFLDTCHSSGSAKDSAGYLRFLEQSKSESEASRSSVLLFASCDEDQVSHEYEPWGHGAFTKALLEALSFDDNKADVYRKGYVNASDLKAYLTERVPELVKQLPGIDGSSPEDQTPVYLGFILSDQDKLTLANDQFWKPADATSSK